MRRMVAVLLGLVLSATAAAAQDRWPVSVGVGGGFISGWDKYHALVTVGIKPSRSPVGLRLDGMWRTQPNRYNGDLLSAVSANAMITLRPWRVSPYLLVGVTRTSEYVINPPLSSTVFESPARTQLTGGFGLETQVRGAKLFLEMRNMQHSGTPLTFGISF